MRLLNVVIELLDVSVIALSQNKIRLSSSKNPVVRRFGNDMMSFVALLLIAYLFAGLIFSVAVVLPDFVREMPRILQNFETIISDGSMTLAYPNFSLFPNLDIMLLLRIFLIIFFVLFFFSFLQKDRDIIKEIDAIRNILIMIYNNVSIGSRQMYMMIFFMVIMSILTFIFLPTKIVIQNLEVVLAFWFSIFMIMAIYRLDNATKIKVHKFLLFTIISPIMIYSVINSSDLDFEKPLGLLLFVITLFFSFERVLKGYYDLREDLFNGTSLLFVARSFTQDDYDKLWNKIGVYKPVMSIDNQDNLILYILTAVSKNDPKPELVKEIVDYCLESFPQNNMVLYLYSKVYLEEKPEVVYDLLCELEKLQKKKAYDIKIYEIPQFKAYALWQMNDVSHTDAIIQLLEGESVPYDELNYILAVCYLENANYSKAYPLLNKLHSDKEYFPDVPYLLAECELFSNKTNHKNFNKYIDKAIKNGIDCEAIINEYKARFANG